MEASMAFMALVVFGVLFLCLACGIWVGFSLFIVGFVGMTLFSSDRVPFARLFQISRNTQALGIKAAKHGLSPCVPLSASCFVRQLEGLGKLLFGVGVERLIITGVNRPDDAGPDHGAHTNGQEERCRAFNHTHRFLHCSA